MLIELFFISLLINSIFIDIVIISIIIIIGSTVHNTSNFCFCKMILLLNLFNILNFIINIKIVIILIKIIIMKLCIIVNFNMLIEFGFCKFNLVHDIIFIC